MYKSRREHQKVYANAGNAFAVGAQRSACRTRGRKVVTLAADANGGLYVDGMRAHCGGRHQLPGSAAGGRSRLRHRRRRQIGHYRILSRQRGERRHDAGQPLRQLAHRGAGDRTARRQAADVAQPALHAADAQQPLGRRNAAQISQRLFVRSKHASRRVEETDEVLAKHIIQDARQSLVINSEIGSLKSSAVLKIDGGQIHMG